MCIRWYLNNLRLHRHFCESRNLMKSGTEIPDQVRNDGMHVWGLFENFPLLVLSPTSSGVEKLKMLLVITPTTGW